MYSPIWMANCYGKFGQVTDDTEVAGAIGHRQTIVDLWVATGHYKLVQSNGTTALHARSWCFIPHLLLNKYIYILNLREYTSPSILRTPQSYRQHWGVG